MTYYFNAGLKTAPYLSRYTVQEIYAVKCRKYKIYNRS